jgi:hypothetical protein
MAEKPAPLGTIEPARERKSSAARRQTAAAPAAQRAPASGELDADFEHRRALRLQLERTYSVHSGVYADPARPTVPLFVAQPRKIVAYDTREPTVRAMLDLAQANCWNAIKVTGDKEFQRRVWVEARARGMDVTLHSNRLLQRAYQPSADDFKIVAKLKEARGLGDRIERAEPARTAAGVWEAALSGKSETRAGSAGESRRSRETPQQRGERYRTAIGAIDAYLESKGVSADLREAIRNLAHLELVERDAAGRLVRAHVVDRPAPGRAAPPPRPPRETDREPSPGR